MKTLQNFFIVLISFTLSVKISSAQQNNFKIGMWNGLDNHTANLTNNYYDVYMQPTLPDGTYSSTMGVLKEDGFNVVLTYQPDQWITKDQYKNLAILAKNSNMQIIDVLTGFYRPNDDGNPWSMNGINRYTANSSDPNAKYNFLDLFDRVYSQVNGTFLGHYLGSEDFTFHMQPLNNTPYPYCPEPDCKTFDPNYTNCLSTICNGYSYGSSWKGAQVPPQNYSDAIWKYQWKKSTFTSPSLNDYIIAGEAVHSGQIPNFDMNAHHQQDRNKPYWGQTWPYSDADAISDPSGCSSSQGHCYYNPEDYFPNSTNGFHKADFFIDDSYFTEPSRTWDENTRNDAYGFYLGKYVSIDYERSKGYDVYSVVGVEQHDDAQNNDVAPYQYCSQFNRDETSFHSNTERPNGNYLWFQAYNSIIHKAKGVFFWELGTLWKPSSFLNDGTNRDSWRLVNYNNGSGFIYSNQFKRTTFPTYYQRYISNLVRELSYLKQQNLLSDNDNSIIYTRTDSVDEMCILPPSANYLPSTIASDDITDFYKDRCCNDNICCYSGDYSYVNCQTGASVPQHRGEEYGLRYTLRTNGKDVIMIITNPNPYSVHFKGSNYMDFGNVPNSVMRTVPKVHLLFEDYSATTDVNSYNYKVENDTYFSRDAVKSTGTFPNFNYSVIKSTTINLTNHTLQLDFGPFDSHIIEFQASDVPRAEKPRDNCWRKVWSNNGSSFIGGWSMLPSDKYIAGNFIDANGDGKEEILCIQSGPGSNWANIIRWNSNQNQWDWTWSNAGNNWINTLPQGWSILPQDKYYAFDYDGDGVDELLCIQGNTNSRAYAAIYKFDRNQNNWRWIWDNGGIGNFGSPQMWPIQKDDIFKVGRFNNQFNNLPIDELMCIQNPLSNSLPKCKILKFGGGSWSSLWYNGNFIGGPGNIGPWPINKYDNYIVGDYDRDGNSELLCIQDPNAGPTTNAQVLNFDNLNNNCTTQYDNQSSGDIAGWGILSGDKIISGQIDNDSKDELMLIQRNGGPIATTMDYDASQSFQWNWSNQNSRFGNPNPNFPSPFINDWKVSDLARHNTDYMFVQCTRPPAQKYLLAFGSYGCDKYIASMYRTDLRSCDATNSPNYKPFEEDGTTDAIDYGVNIFPNPNTGNFRIEFELNDLQKINIQLLNSLGKVLREENYSTLQKGTNSIDFSGENLQNGIYYIKVSGNDFNKVKPLTIIK